MIRVSDHVFVETKYLGANVGCIVTERGLVLVDTPMLPEEARDLTEQIREFGGLDIAYIIYTHQHFDHVMGSAFFSKPVIAYQGVISGLNYLKTGLGSEMLLFWPEVYKERKDVFDCYEIVMPHITFSDRLQLDMGNNKLELEFVGAHSSASILVHVKGDRVVFSGDNLVTDTHPVTANCRFKSWIDLLHRLEQMDIDVIVPGHGPACGKEGVIRMYCYFENLRSQVLNFIDAGVSQEAGAVKLNLAVPYPSTSQENMQNVRSDYEQMYSELVKTSPQKSPKSE